MNHLRYHQTQPLHLPGTTQSLMKGKCSQETSEDSRGTARVRAQVYSPYARAGHLPRALGSRSSADRCQPLTAAPETSPILFACPPAEKLFGPSQPLLKAGCLTLYVLLGFPSPRTPLPLGGRRREFSPPGLPKPPALSSPAAHPHPHRTQVIPAAGGGPAES